MAEMIWGSHLPSGEQLEADGISWLKHSSSAHTDESGTCPAPRPGLHEQLPFLLFCPFGPVIAFCIWVTRAVTAVLVRPLTPSFRFSQVDQMAFLDKSLEPHSHSFPIPWLQVADIFTYLNLKLRLHQLPLPTGSLPAGILLFPLPSLLTNSLRQNEPYVTQLPHTPSKGGSPARLKHGHPHTPLAEANMATGSFVPLLGQDPERHELDLTALLPCAPAIPASATWSEITWAIAT